MPSNSKKRMREGAYVAILDGNVIGEAASLDELWELLESKDVDYSKLKVTFRKAAKG
ncbi:MAG: hypothetical protein QXV32_07895 [Conexivisphaerales archaeon]